MYSRPIVSDFEIERDPANIIFKCIHDNETADDKHVPYLIRRWLCTIQRTQRSKKKLKNRFLYFLLFLFIIIFSLLPMLPTRASNSVAHRGLRLTTGQWATAPLATPFTILKQFCTLGDFQHSASA
jgi:hypothetical protein